MGYNTGIGACERAATPKKETAMTRIAVFDLDGTLLDTLDDLHAAVNRALTRADLPARTREEIRAFVGDGVELLIRRAVPADLAKDPDGETKIRAILADFKADYAANCAVATAPYAGILALLDALRAADTRIAVVSNKFDAATKALCARYFGDRIDVAMGEREADGVRKKPYPDTVFEALTALGATVGAGVTYIGDSEVDVQTARNAGIPCISVTWGFRDEDLLRARGATVVAHTPDEVLQILTNG